jgi:hypothetical protein
VQQHIALLSIDSGRVIVLPWHLFVKCVSLLHRSVFSLAPQCFPVLRDSIRPGIILVCFKTFVVSFYCYFIQPEGGKRSVVDESTVAVDEPIKPMEDDGDLGL